MANRWENNGNSDRLYFFGLQNHWDGDCSHEIKRRLLLRRKAMTNLDSILKSRDITLPTKVCLVIAMVFPLVMYECESWTIKKAERWRTDAFDLWCWRRLLTVPWTAKRWTCPSYRKSVLTIHWKDRCWSWNSNTLAPWCKELTHWKRPWCWERLKVGGEGDNRGWDGWMASLTQLNGHEFEQALEVGDRQGSLVCCSPWGCKELDVTELSDWLTEISLGLILLAARSAAGRMPSGLTPLGLSWNTPLAWGHASCQRPTSSG